MIVALSRSHRHLLATVIRFGDRFRLVTLCGLEWITDGHIPGAFTCQREEVACRGCLREPSGCVISSNLM